MKKNNEIVHKFLLIPVVGIVVFLSIFLMKQEEKKHTQLISKANEEQAISFQENKNGLIEYFPTIPLYPDALVQSSYKKIIYDSRGYQAEWITSDPVKDVLMFYKDALPADGWVIDFMPENFEAYEAQIEAHKENRKLFLMIEVAETHENMTEIVAEFPLDSI